MSDADGEAGGVKSGDPGASGRVRARKVSLAGAKGRIEAFFAGRAEKRDERNPYVSVIYQDRNPELAERRDREEKALILPKLALTPGSRVLDVGCGLGRWADALQGKVARYVGVDFSPEMIALARERHDAGWAEFRVLGAQDVSAATLGVAGAFDRAIIAGVFIYMDDEDVVRCLKGLRELLAPGGLVYVREPMAVDERLTLNGVWSEELQQTYYAIYRTRAELGALIEEGLGAPPPEFVPLFADAGLNNRAETRQFYCIIGSAAP